MIGPPKILLKDQGSKTPTSPTPAAGNFYIEPLRANLRFSYDFQGSADRRYKQRAKHGIAFAPRMPG